MSGRGKYTVWAGGNWPRQPTRCMSIWLPRKEALEEAWKIADQGHRFVGVSRVGEYGIRYLLPFCKHQLPGRPGYREWCGRSDIVSDSGLCHDHHPAPDCPAHGPMTPRPLWQTTELQQQQGTWYDCPEPRCTTANLVPSPELRDLLAKQAAARPAPKHSPAPAGPARQDTLFDPAAWGLQ